MHSIDRKWEMFKRAQENTYLLKRINERTSFYSTWKSLDDYAKTKAYKNNICVFPNIEFHKTIDNAGWNNDLRMGTMNFNDTGIRYIKTPDHKVRETYIFGGSSSVDYGNQSGFNKTGTYSQTIQSNIEEHLLSDSEGKKLFYDKKVFFADLFHCMIKCYVEDKR
jgi:hypothetical protein